MKQMDRAQVADFMDKLFAECKATYGDGQKEYAHKAVNAFANFERIAERLGPPHTRETVLVTFYEKHIDGIHSWIQGHRSQREKVRGRFKDAVVYLVILAAMAACAEQEEVPSVG